MKTFLFSVDLEGARVGDSPYRIQRVADMTRKYLDFLSAHKARATFFVVGQTAVVMPGLIQEIITAGHEIACHSHTHAPLYEHTPESFRIDLHNNISALKTAGAHDIRGFRAPILSLTAATQWVYPI